MRVAIVGAGMAGLACGEALAARGHAPVLFDKGRRAGGRMSTCRIATALGEASFDHGAQYFTARDPAFAARVERWRAAGEVSAWPAAGEDAWVGTPGMNAPAKAMAAGLDVRSGVRVDALERDARGWRLRGDDAEASPFDGLVLAVPAEQVVALIEAWDPALAAAACATPSQPCWTVMAAFAAPLPFAPDVVRDRAPIGWAARNRAKPGREGPEAWVVQADPTWSRRHLEQDEDTVAADLLATLFEVLTIAPRPTLALAAHRWRFARAGIAAQPPAWNPALRLGACGDWVVGPRVESAWLSGDALGRAIADA